MTFFPTKVYTLIVTCFKIKIKVIDKKSFADGAKI